MYDTETIENQQLMELQSVRKLLEKEGGPYESIVDSLSERFFEPFVSEGLKVDLVEPGRVLCSLTVPPRLLNTANTLHGGATATLVDLVGSAVILTHGTGGRTGVSVEINVSYLDSAVVGEEIEVEGKALRMGKAIAVVTVELRKKKTGKIIALGRHTKYRAVSSKL